MPNCQSSPGQHFFISHNDVIKAKNHSMHQVKKIKFSHLFVQLKKIMAFVSLGGFDRRRVEFPHKMQCFDSRRCGWRNDGWSMFIN